MSEQQNVGNILRLKTIDITPTWEGQMRMAIILLEDGTFEGKKFAREEIIRAGQIIDNLIEEYGVE